MEIYTAIKEFEKKLTISNDKNNLTTTLINILTILSDKINSINSSKRNNDSILLEKCIDILFVLNDKHNFNFKLLGYYLNYCYACLKQKSWDLKGSIKYIENSIDQLSEYNYNSEAPAFLNNCINCKLSTKGNNNFLSVTKIIVSHLYLTLINALLHLQNAALYSQNNAHYLAFTEASNSEYFILYLLFILPPILTQIIKHYSSIENDSNNKKTKKQFSIFDFKSLNIGAAELSTTNDLKLSELEELNNIITELILKIDISEHIEAFSNDITILCKNCVDKRIEDMHNITNKSSKSIKELYYNKASNLNFLVWKHIPENNSRLILNSKTEPTKYSNYININIGHIMHLSALDPNIFKLKNLELPNFNYFAEIILIYTAALFSKATEKKFLLINEISKNEKNKGNLRVLERNVKLSKSEELWKCERMHFKATDILKQYIGNCAMLSHIVNSYKKNYSDIIDCIVDYYNNTN